MTDTMRELRRQVGKRIYLTRKAIWGTEDGDRKRCLAEMDVSTNQLSRWETGQSEPSLMFIVDLHKRHDVTADWILLNDRRRLPCELSEGIKAVEAREGK